MAEQQCNLDIQPIVIQGASSSCQRAPDPVFQVASSLDMAWTGPKRGRI